MDEELEKPEPKISLVVGILVLLVCVVMDVISFIPFFGDIEEVPGVLGIVLSAVFGLGGAIILLESAVAILKAIPFVQALPLWSIGWGSVWWMENHPSKLTKPIQQVADIGAIAEGDLSEIGEEAEAVAETAARSTEAIEEAAAVAQEAEEAEAVAAEAEATAAGAEGGESRGRTTQAGEAGGEAGAEGEESAESKEEKEKADEMADPNEKDPMKELLKDQLGGDSNTLQFPQNSSQNEDEDEEDEKDEDDHNNWQRPKAA